MTVTARIAREDAITDALRAANDAIGNDAPTAQALRIIRAIKLLRAAEPARIAQLAVVNYMAQLQQTVQRSWLEKHGDPDGYKIGPEHDAVAGIDTPIGRFRAVTWRARWRTGRVAWASEYYLNDEPITVAEIEAAGLAQRPTTRNRQRRAA